MLILRTITVVDVAVRTGHIIAIVAVVVAEIIAIAKAEINQKTVVDANPVQQKQNNYKNSTEYVQKIEIFSRIIRSHDYLWVFMGKLRTRAFQLRSSTLPPSQLLHRASSRKLSFAVSNSLKQIFFQKVNRFFWKNIFENQNNMNIIKTIEKRKSCRTFNGKALTQDDKQKLEQFITANKVGLEGQEIYFGLVDKKDSAKELKINYGMITGHASYVFGKIKSDANSRLNYGYLMEKLVLEATRIGIAICWIGIFDSEYFSDFVIEEGYEVPSMVILGYPEEKPSFVDKLQRFGVGAAKRNEWNKQFFNHQSGAELLQLETHNYSSSLEMTRLAPSSGNTQPWRIYFDKQNKEFHFYKQVVNKRYEEKGVHDIDMGIAMAHFELASYHHELSGNWFKSSSTQVPSKENLQYIRSWKCA